MKIRVLTNLAVLMSAAAAPASFTGFAATSQLVVDGQDSWLAMDVYATFDNEADVLLNIFNTAVSISGGFGIVHHEDFLVGSWAPQIAESGLLDSYVLIGGYADSRNTTHDDPNWGPQGFDQLTIPPNAGWFNSTPPNLQGQAVPVAGVGLATRIMHVVIPASSTSEAFLTITASYTSYQGVGTPAEQGTDTGTFSFGDAIVPTTLFVKADAVGANSGLSWADAFTSLQAALSVAVFGQEIWVGAGTYKPTQGTDRTISFDLIQGTRVYGGFGGFETCPEQRDPIANPTILSGDIGVPGVATDNSFNVVQAEDFQFGSKYEYETVLDGFIITAGQADFVIGGNSLGGGLYIDDANPIIRDCRFISNVAVNGGAVHSANNLLPSSPELRDCEFRFNAAIGTGSSGRGGAILAARETVIDHCLFEGNTGRHGGAISHTQELTVVCRSTFLDNHASLEGGAVHVGGANPEYTDCLFDGNVALQFGGAVYLSVTAGSPDFHLCTLVGNSAVAGGGLYDARTDGSSAQITNSILWMNSPEAIVLAGGAAPPSVTFSCVQGGWPGRGNISSDPLFVDAEGPDGMIGTADDDLRLTAASPCVDAGDDVEIPLDDCDVDDDGDTEEYLPLDLDGLVRVAGRAVDMGAYEQGSAAPPFCPADLTHDGVIDGFDLALLLGAWGDACGPADLNHDGVINGFDLAVLLGAWGPCR